MKVNIKNIFKNTFHDTVVYFALEKEEIVYSTRVEGNYKKIVLKHEIMHLIFIDKPCPLCGSSEAYSNCRKLMEQKEELEKELTKKRLRFLMEAIL